MTQSDLEETFVFWWRQLGPDITLIREYPCIPKRRYRFDFVHEESRVAIELQGGIYGKGRKRGSHIRPKGYERDCEKNNLAIMHGWVVLAFTSGMLSDDPMGCMDMVRDVIARRLK